MIAWIILAALVAPNAEQLTAEAGAHLTAGRFAAAAAGFRSALAQQPEFPDALFGLGLACGQLGRYEEAQRTLRHYVALRPKAAEGHAALGTILLAAGDRAAARTELSRALAIDSGNLESAKALAQIELGEFNPARATVLLSPFAASSDFDDNARLLLASGYAGRGDARAAAALLAPRLEAQPAPPPEFFAQAALAAWKTGDAGAAERACYLGMLRYLNSDEIDQRCVRLVSRGFVRELEAAAADPAALIVLGRLLTDAVESADAPERVRARTVLEKAVALQPGDPTALYNLGRCLRVQGQPGAALAPLGRALSEHPEPELETLIRTQSALCRQALQDYPGATQEFRRAWELNRTLSRHLPDAGFRFYTFLTHTGQESKAEPVLQELLQWDPTFLPGRMERARLLSAADRTEEALREAEVVARHVDPASLELARTAHLLLFQLYTRLDRAEEASHHQQWLEQNR